MIVRTCLLISDDPDDHSEFSEALYEISDNTVVVSVSDIRKAIDLLVVKKCIPEFIFINAGIAGFDADYFFGTLKNDPLLEDIRIIAYGESGPLNAPGISATLESELSYSELKDALRKIVM